MSNIEPRPGLWLGQKVFATTCCGRQLPARVLAVLPRQSVTWAGEECAWLVRVQYVFDGEIMFSGNALRPASRVHVAPASQWPDGGIL